MLRLKNLSWKKIIKKKKLDGGNLYISQREIKILSCFLRKIRKRVIDLKNTLFNRVWERQENVPTILNKIFKLQNQVVEFNKIIKRYFDLQVKLDDNGEFSFYKGKEELELDKFSSGECNIIYLFFQLIFNEVSIYLIDEPEISLSLSFQKRIIGDIFEVLGEDKKVILATHAPYIYKDFKEYDKNNKLVQL